MSDSEETEITKKIKEITRPHLPDPKMLEKHIKAEKKEKHESDMWNGKSGNGSCVACHESGDMMNCDVCHLSIHLECADPPVLEEKVNSVDAPWLCKKCLILGKDKEVNQDNRLTLGQINLLKKGEALNEISSEKSTEYLIKNSSLVSESEKKQNEELKIGNAWSDYTASEVFKHEEKYKPPQNCLSLTPGAKKNKNRKTQRNEKQLLKQFCYVCDKNSRYGQMIVCDYCPKVYHLDCLDPPLTYYPPNKKFMCNLHPQKETFEQVRSEGTREIIQNIMSQPIDPQQIRIDFMKKVKHEEVYNKEKANKHNRTLVKVPQALKDIYKVNRNKKEISAPSQPQNFCGLEMLASAAFERKKVEITPKTIINESKEIKDLHSSVNQLLKEDKSPKNDKEVDTLSRVDQNKKEKPENNESSEMQDKKEISYQFTKNDITVKQKKSDKEKNSLNGVKPLENTTNCRVMENITSDASSLDEAVKRDLLNKLLAHPPETLMQIFNLCAEIKSKDIKESFKGHIPKTSNLQNKMDDLAKKMLNKGIPIRCILKDINYGNKFYIFDNIATVGRSSNCTIQLTQYENCKKIENTHCDIFYDQATDTWQLLCTASTYVDDFHYGLDLQVSDEKTDKDNKFQKLLKEFFKKNRLHSDDFPIQSQPIHFIKQFENDERCECNKKGKIACGYEGAAALHHGSHIKIGCYEFVFCINPRMSRLKPSCPGEYDTLYRKLLKRRKTSLITSSDAVKQEFCSESEGNLNFKIETSKEKKQRKKKRKADESRDSCSSTEKKDSVSRRKKLKKMKRKEENLRKKRMVKKLKRESNENHGEIASIKSFKSSSNSKNHENMAKQNRSIQKTSSSRKSLTSVKPAVINNSATVTTSFNKKQSAKYQVVKATKLNPGVTSKPSSVKEHKLLYSNHHANNNNSNKLHKRKRTSSVSKLQSSLQSPSSSAQKSSRKKFKPSNILERSPSKPSTLNYGMAQLSQHQIKYFDQQETIDDNYNMDSHLSGADKNEICLPKVKK